MSSSFLNDRYNLYVYTQLTNDLFSKHPDKKPTAVIYGGQPGAGKSLLKSYISDSHPGIAILDGDELRKLHPDYKALAKSDPANMPGKTQQFVYDILDSLKKYAQDNKKSYALETTFHDGQKTHESFQEAKSLGFRTELHVLAVNPKASYLSTLQRFEEGFERASVGRTVDKEIHFDRAKKNTEAFRFCLEHRSADSVSLYRRMIIDNKPVVTRWKDNPDRPLDDFLRERTRPFKSNELKAYQNVAQSVLNQMENRKAKPEEIKAFKADFSQFLDTDQNKGKGIGR